MEKELGLESKYIVLWDNILVSFKKASDKTEGGLTIPKSMQKDEKGIGTIELVGPECRYPFKRGDKVVLKGTGQLVPIDGIDYIQMQEYNILGILN